MTVTTHTIRYGWHTIRESYEAICAGCGKRYKRIASTGYNDQATPEKRAEYRADLKVHAETLSQIPITCNACQKGAISAANPVVLIRHETLDKIAAIEADQTALDERKRGIEREIDQQRGRLFRHEGEVYSQWGCGFGWDGDRFTVHGYRVNKVRPWETTDVQVHAPLTKIAYLDDTLENRKAAVRKRGS